MHFYCDQWQNTQSSLCKIRIKRTLIRLCGYSFVTTNAKGILILSCDDTKYPFYIKSFSIIYAGTEAYTDLYQLTQKGFEYTLYSDYIKYPIYVLNVFRLYMQGGYTHL